MIEHFEHELDNSALKVNKGIHQPESTNKDAIKKFLKQSRKKYTVTDYVEGILKGDMVILSQAITMIESSNPQHLNTAQEIIEKCLPYSGKSVRIGITGVPGVGKSSFIEVFGSLLTEKGHKLAVLAIDPSSERSSGSILGDKTRMEKLSTSPNAFIRPSPTGGSLGGVARKTRESAILCEAAGFNIIFIETVGVGQTETAVHSMVDFFLLLMLAGAGDELQGIKRGIMEMADTIAITKADGQNLQKAELAKREYQNALHLFPPTLSGWIPQVITCSSRDNSGLPEIWKIIEDYLQLTQNNNYFDNKRREQAKNWMYETIQDTLTSHFFTKERKEEIRKFENQVLEGKITSFSAAKFLLNDYFKTK